MPPWWLRFVDARRHRFSLKASRDQYFSLLILWALFLTSLLAWPADLSFPFRLLQFGALGVICFYFSYQLLSLKRWQWQFSVDALGCLEDERGKHTLSRRWVTPFVCLIMLKNQDGGRRLEWVFADMLADGDYRDLCRLLISARGLE